MASKEELRKLMLAMNPDAEQIEEAAAAAPRVPKAAKALGKGFYEANIAPLLSPKETAMAIFGAGREFVKDPKAFGEAAAKSELERLKAAGEKPEAAAEYAGSFLSPFSMLRRMPNRSEIDAYHGSPAKFEPTVDNPLGEFDITKMGSGIGQQQRGPGTYIAEMKRATNRFRLAPGSGDLSKGFVYTVDLPDSMIEKMLDLDAPIMNQPKIRETLLKIADDNVLPRESADYLRYMLTSTDETLRKYPLTGQGLVAVPRELGGIFRDNVEANTVLQRYGIPGSKWDAGLFKEDIAKGREKASRNFVVFPGEERKVRILEREGGGERVKSTPVKRAAGSPPKGETSASQEELRRLIRAMNPDSEQIEEAAAAAPRVPSVAKSLSKGFYEANVEPLLSPYDTAMAIFGAGKEFVSDPKEFSQSVARAEMERLRAAGDKPEAAAEYYGGLLSPFSMLRRVPPTSNVIKPKGGDFPKNLTPIESLNYKFPGDVVEQLPPVRRENLTKIMPAVDNWINTKLDRYIRTEMATPEDPIRKLAEQDILHVAPGNLIVGAPRDPAIKSQKLAQSDLAAEWETASDNAFTVIQAGTIADKNASKYKSAFLADLYKDKLQEDPWIATVAQKDPNRPIYFPKSNQADYLGFRHLKDELFNSLRLDSDLPQQLRMTPEQLGRMSVPDAVRHVSKINRWREKQKAEANLALATNAATVPFKDYPNQKFGWFQLKANTPQGRRALEDALKYEGDMMGHCVGGYCEDVFSGRSEIYSLRNKKTGEPHVTIEVTQPIQPGDFYYQTADQGLIPRFPGVPPSFISRLDEAEKSGKPFNWEQIVKESPEYQALPKTILQIKGKGDRKPNATYIPFVQDFVRSQNWMDIRELRNADLVDLKDTVSALAWINTKMATHVSPEALKSLQDEGVRFATIEELNARHSAMVKERVAARKAAEPPEQKAARQQLRELRRAERRRERGE